MPVSINAGLWLSMPVFRRNDNEGCGLSSTPKMIWCCCYVGDLPVALRDLGHSVAQYDAIDAQTI